MFSSSHEISHRNAIIKIVLLLKKELAYCTIFVVADNISSLMYLLIKILALHEANFGFLYMSNVDIRRGCNNVELCST